MTLGQHGVGGPSDLPIPFDPVSILGPLHAPYDALKTAAKALVMGAR